MPIDPRSLPAGVFPTEDDGIYLVASQSRDGKKHRVCVMSLLCNCESATMGKSHEVRKEKGYLPAYAFCHHLRQALVYDSLVLRTWLEREQRAKKGKPV